MSRRTVYIENLTTSQTELLDEIWGKETYDDLIAWLRTLPMDTFKEAVSLVKLLELEILEANMNKQFTDAKKVLQKFRL